jgi:hypothetical protein
MLGRRFRIGNSLTSWDDVFELACTPFEENDSLTFRLIQHIPDTLDTYQVEFGPFEPSDLAVNLKQNDNVIDTCRQRRGSFDSSCFGLDGPVL